MPWFSKTSSDVLTVFLSHQPQFLQVITLRLRLPSVERVLITYFAPGSYA